MYGTDLSIGYCGNVFVNNGVVVNSQQVSCAGNASEACGGPSDIAVYMLSALSSSTSSNVASSSSSTGILVSSTPSATSSLVLGTLSGPSTSPPGTSVSGTVGTSTGPSISSSSAEPTVVQTAVSFTYFGSYQDTQTVRISGSTITSGISNVQSCALVCASYPYMGVESGNECKCS